MIVSMFVNWRRSQGGVWQNLDQVWVPCWGESCTLCSLPPAPRNSSGNCPSLIPSLFELWETLGHYYSILLSLLPETFARTTSVASFCSVSPRGIKLGSEPLALLCMEGDVAQNFSCSLQRLPLSLWGLAEGKQLISICKAIPGAVTRTTRKGQV